MSARERPISDRKVPPQVPPSASRRESEEVKAAKIIAEAIIEAARIAKEGT